MAQYTAVELNQAGLALLKAGRCDEALPKFEQAAIADPTYYEPLNNSAFCLFDQGQVDQAIAEWREALVLNPSSADAHAGLGMALFAQGDQDQGQQHYQEALRIEANYHDPDWMKRERLWSDHALSSSSGLRDVSNP